ncbi:M14 family metallopeptidase [Ottowia sp.]|uniref:M14 family metallopeptidase n=1 Tax=Ottowia sp. TaxID=1898956 RepID=UPI003A85C152
MGRSIGRTVLIGAGLMGAAALVAAAVVSWRFAHYQPAEADIAPDPQAQAYFMDDYASARQAFLAQGDALAQRLNGVERFAIAVDSPRGIKDLYVDGLYVPAQSSPQRLLVLSAATHGIEGPAGSAVMRMFMAEFMQDELLAQTGVLFLHALNPYGFAQQRRVTEGNVDLNRNAGTNNALYQTQNAGYPVVHPLINPAAPADTQSWSHRLFLLRALGQVARHGMPVLRQAVLQGQYSTPQGIYYGGQALEPQLAALAPRLRALLNQYPLSMSIDLHTGYGERGKLHIFLNPPEDPHVRDALQAVFTGHTIDWGSGQDFYTVTGDVTSWIGTLRQGGAHLPAVFEYGTMNSQTTIGAIKSLHISVLENQGVQHGWASDDERVRIQRDYREMFNPSSSVWRTQVIARSRTLLRDVLAQLPQVQVQP